MRRILVTDDNKLDRKVISQILHNNLTDISIHEAKDGAEALKQVKEINFDIVITDLVMPEIEGLELIHKIFEINPSQSIIAITGTNPYYLVLAKKMGIEAVFTKPINTQKFLKHIKGLLPKAKSLVRTDDTLGW